MKKTMLISVYRQVFFREFIQALEAKLFPNSAHRHDIKTDTIRYPEEKIYIYSSF